MRTHFSICLIATLVSCAYPLESGASGRVLESRSPAEESVPVADQDPGGSFEEGYRDDCDEHGATGVTAGSMTSIVESMAALCGASVESGSEESPDATSDETPPGSN